jgi:hypothetical protein
MVSNALWGYGWQERRECIPQAKARLHESGWEKMKQLDPHDKDMRRIYDAAVAGSKSLAHIDARTLAGNVAKYVKGLMGSATAPGGPHVTSQSGVAPAAAPISHVPSDAQLQRMLRRKRALDRLDAIGPEAVAWGEEWTEAHPGGNVETFEAAIEERWGV